MAGSEEVLFNVIGDVSEAVSALNEWMAAIDNVTKSFDALGESIAGLDEKLSSLNGTISGLVESFSSLDEAAGGVSETLGAIDESLSAASEAVSNMAQAAQNGAGSVDELAATLDAVDQSAAPVAESIDSIVESLATMQEGVTTAVDELSQLGPQGEDAAMALMALDDALNNAATGLVNLGDDAAGVDNIINELAGPISSVNQSLSALSDEAAGPAKAAFMDLLDQWDNALGTAGELSAAMDSMAQSATAAAAAASQVGSAVDGESGGLQAGVSAALELADAQITAANSAAYLVQSSFQAQTTLVQNGAAVQTATQGFAGFSSILDIVGSAVDNVVAGIQNLNAQLLELAADESVAGSAAAEADSGMSGDAYMLQMLIPMIAQVAGGFLKMGSDAEDAIAHITGLADQSLALAENSNKLNTDISALEQSAQKYGVSMKDAANGLYYIISAGFQTSDALKVLNVSMEASAATGAQMQSVSNALTSVLHAYNLTASQSKNVMDQMVAAVVGGKQDFQEFANVIGRTAAVGSQAHFSLTQLLAAEAELTQINPSVRQDTQNLANLMAVLSTGTAKTASAAHTLGLSFDEAKYKTMDLYDKVKYLNEITGGNSDKMRTLLQNATAYNTAMNLLRDNGVLFTAQMQNQGNAIGSTDKAFQQASQTISFALSRITAALSVMSYELIRAIGPVVAPLFDHFAGLMDNLAAHTNILIPVLVGLAIALGVVLVAAISTVAGMFAPLLASVLPIAVAIGAIGAVVAIVVPRLMQLAQSNSTLGIVLRATGADIERAASALRNALGGALTALHPLLQGLGTIFNAVIIPAFGAFAAGAGQTFAAILRQIVAAIQAATPHIQAFGNYVRTNIAPALQAAMPHITAFAMELGRWLPAILPVIAGLLGFRGVISGVLSVAGGLSSVLGAAGSAFNIVRLGVQYAIAGFQGFGVGVVWIIENVGKLGGIVRTVAGFLVNNFGSALTFIRGIIPTVAAFIANAGGPLQALFAVVRGGVAVITGFGADLIALINPVTAIAAAVIFLAGMLVVWLTTTKQGHQALSALGAMLMSVWNILVANLRPAWAQLQQAMDLIMQSLRQLWTALQPLIPPLEKLGMVLGAILVVAIMVAISALVGIITALANFAAGLAMVIAHVVQFVTGIVQAFSGMWNMLKGLFTGNSRLMQQGWQQFVQGIENIWNGFTGAIIGVFQTAINTIIGLGKGFFSTLSGMFSSFADAIVHHSIWPDMWTAIHANTVQSTAQVHAQVQTFSTQTQATFLQMQTASVAAMGQTWQRVQTQITASMNASTTSVRIGFTAMNAQVVASGSVILQSTTTTWSAITKDITQTLSVTTTAVSASFSLMAANINKSLTLAQSDNVRTWTQIAKDTTTGMNLVVTSINTAYTTIYKTITTNLTNISQIELTSWNALIQTTRTNWTLLISLYTQGWQTLYDDTKTWETNLYTLCTQQWDLQITLLKTNLTLETTLWTQWWTALIQLERTNWKTIETDTTTAMNLINVAITNGTKQIQTTIQALITWITQQMTALDKNATTWGADFAKNFAAGINSQLGAVRAAAQAVANAAKAALGHSKPSEGPMSDDDVWGEHFIQNFASGMERGIPVLTQAAQNAASIIASTMPTAQSVAAATQSSSGVINGAEHLAVLKQILAQLKQNASGSGSGGVNNFVGGSTSIGYNIPSTQLGSIIQQFGNNSLRLSPNDIANIYQQLNTLQGLSQEYAARGSTTGIGF